MTRTAALAALALSIFFAGRPASAGECRGLKSAHCRCELRYPSDGANANATNGWLRPTGIDDKVLLTYTIPNQCFNQQADWVNYHLDKGCWSACRNAYGVDGATPDPAMKKAIGEAPSSCARWAPVAAGSTPPPTSRRAPTTTG